MAIKLGLVRIRLSIHLFIHLVSLFVPMDTTCFPKSFSGREEREETFCSIEKPAGLSASSAVTKPFVFPQPLASEREKESD